MLIVTVQYFSYSLLILQPIIIQNVKLASSQESHPGENSYLPFELLNYMCYMC